MQQSSSLETGTIKKDPHPNEPLIWVFRCRGWPAFCNWSSPFSSLRALEFLGLFLKWPPGGHQVSLGSQAPPTSLSSTSSTPDLSQESGPQVHHHTSPSHSRTQLFRVTRESRRNSRKSTWFPRHHKMRPLPATASQEKSHVPS